jgi:hypothetical protein
MGPPGPSYIGMVGKVLAENLKKSKTLEDNGSRTRIKTVDIIFRSLRIICCSFHSAHTRSNISEVRLFRSEIRWIFLLARKGIKNVWIYKKEWATEHKKAADCSAAFFFISVFIK